jgi:CAAX prenyl protease-like protein
MTPTSNDNSNQNRMEIPVDTIAFVLPLFVFLLVVQFFYEDFAGDTIDAGATDASPKTVRYMYAIGTQVLIAASFLVAFGAIYRKHFPIRISAWPFAIGTLGVVLWIFLSELGIEEKIGSLIAPGTFSSDRPAFNPFEQIPADSTRWTFLGLRFALLAIFVPIIEELFLRGWLVRWIHDVDWKEVKYSGLSFAAIAAPTAYGVLTHSEKLAALVWFSLITWMMLKTKNFWDCVLAHAITNLLLGLYVIWSGNWQLW